MYRRMFVLGLLAVALTLALAGEATAAAIKGTVVHKNRGAKSFVVASRGGRLCAIHARHSPGLGSVVRVSARRLRNGTFAARHVKVAGKRRHARVRGTVSYVSRRGGVFTVSARGASLLIHRGHSANRASASNGLPGPGTEVEVDVELHDQGDLEEQDIQELGEDSNGIELEGVVLNIDPAARTLSVSADDDDQSGAALTVHLPASVDLSVFAKGQEVELTVTPNPDGTFELVQSSLDDNQQEADDSSDDQGDDSQNGDSGSNEGNGSNNENGSNGGDD
jgi:hypothetical protein